MDFYTLLEVERDATPEEIKSAYRRLAKQYHPDLNPGDKNAEEKFKFLAKAYEVLSSPNKRAIYDHVLAQHEQHKNDQPDPSAYYHDDYYEPRSNARPYEPPLGRNSSNENKFIRILLWSLLIVFNFIICKDRNTQQPAQMNKHFIDSLFQFYEVTDSVGLKWDTTINLPQE